MNIINRSFVISRGLFKRSEVIRDKGAEINIERVYKRPIKKKRNRTLWGNFCIEFKLETKKTPSNLFCGIAK